MDSLNKDQKENMLDNCVYQIQYQYSPHPSEHIIHDSNSKPIPSEHIIYEFGVKLAKLISDQKLIKVDHNTATDDILFSCDLIMIERSEINNILEEYIRKLSDTKIKEIRSTIPK
jgi:hypothetical protein